MSTKKRYAKLEELMEILANPDTKSDNIENESNHPNFAQSPLQAIINETNSEPERSNKTIQHYMFSTKHDALRLCFMLINYPKKFNFYHEKVIETLVPCHSNIGKVDDNDTNNNRNNNHDINFMLIASWCNKNNKLEVDFYVCNIENLMLTKDVWRSHVAKSVIFLLESLEVSYNWKNIDFNYVCLKCDELFETKTKADMHLTTKHNTSIDAIQPLDTNKYVVMYEASKTNFKSLKASRFELSYYDEVDKVGLPFWATSNVMCTICDVVFGSVNELDEHNRVIHSLNNPLNFGNNSNTKNTINNLLTAKIPNSNTTSNTNNNANNVSLSRHQTKEYRCTICNYKTVTKGNLHIHFQSEKHRNNQREHDQNEQRNTIAPFTATPHHHHHAPQQQTPIQHKSVNNDTTARTQLPPPPQPPTSLNNQLLSINPLNFMDNLLNIQKHQESGTMNLATRSLLTSSNYLTLPPIFECDICHNFIHSDIEVMLEHADRPRPLPSNAEVSKIVRVQSSSSSISTSLDNTTSPSSSSSTMMNGSVNPSNSSELEHICLLDGYKTRIKANFLLHFKTEKHQQKLQLLAHAREGGLDNANKYIVQMVNEPISLVSIRCNLCNATFSTPHKLRLHVDTHDHQMNQKIASSFQMWQRSVDNNTSLNNQLDMNINNFSFECKPCGLIFKRYLEILDHFHTQRNSLHMNYFKKEMNLAALIKIHYPNSVEKDNNLPNDKIHKMENDSNSIKCNLCNDTLSRINLRNHLKEIHKINDDCLSRMVSIAEELNACKQSNVDSEYSSTNHIRDDQNNDNADKLRISNRPTTWTDCILIGDIASSEPMIRCQYCVKYFSTVPLLEEHLYQEQHCDQHDNCGILCYKKGCNQYFNNRDLMIDHFYEIHAFQIAEYKTLGTFKYICKVCHLFAFSSSTKCSDHIKQHHQLSENMFSCVVCRNEFNNNTRLRLHIEEEHLIDSDITNEEIDSKDNCAEMTLDVCKLDEDTKSEVNDVFSNQNDLSESHLIKTESISNVEEENNLHRNMSEPTNLYGHKISQSSLHAPLLSTAISDLLQSVGSENIKLILETMINSRNKQSINDFTTFSSLNPTDSLLNNNILWLQLAEPLITNANIHDSLKERCRNCNFLFSNQNILEKHKKLCGPNINLSSQLEFDNNFTLCRDHITKTLLSSANNITMPHNPFNESNSNLFSLTSNLRPPPPPSSIIPHMGLFSLLNQYNRFPFNNPTSLNNTPNYFLPPPLGTFSSLRLRNFPPNNSSPNLYFPSSVKPNSSTPPLNTINFPPNLPDLSKSHRDNYNSKHNSSATNTTTPTIPTSSNTTTTTLQQQSSQPKLETNRKRTQIKNYQYEILRSYFNINNPPNDEIVSEIIIKTGLDRKTVKHWFRNTLFKERQKCKDSPYNFNIPPEISLNIEEYEKTGKIEIKSPISTATSNNMSSFTADKVQKRSFSSTKLESSVNNDMSPNKITKNQSCDIKTVSNSAPVNDEYEKDASMKDGKDSNNNKETTLMNLNKIKAEKEIPMDTNGEPFTAQSQLSTMEYNSNSESIITNDENDEEEKRSEKVVDLPLDLSTPAITAHHLSSLSNSSNQNNGNNANLSGHDSFNLDPVSPFGSEHDFSDLNCGTNSLSGERRHRTTLTAMQIHAMKSIFIHCRSPSHNELGALGNILSLDMRVVQVWFQNQRAKLKKQERDIYCRDKQTAIFPEAIPSIIETCDSPNNTSHSESENCKAALIGDNDSSNPSIPTNAKTHCLVCNQMIHPTISKQTHLFSIVHLTNLMRYLVTKTNDFKVNWKQTSNSAPSSSTHSLLNSTTPSNTPNTNTASGNSNTCISNKINA